MRTLKHVPNQLLHPISMWAFSFNLMTYSYTNGMANFQGIFQRILLQHNRPQQVGLSGTRSDELIGNTGTPQRCVLSPILFSVYTNEVVSTNALLTLVKFTDLVVCLQDENSIEEYFLLLDLNSWFKESFFGCKYFKNERTSVWQ